MSSRFLDKVCVVTASTDGIGFAIARRFAEEGGKVLISSRKASNVHSSTAALRKVAKTPDHIEGVVCHVGKEADRHALLEKAKAAFGSIDVLVLNAAASTHYGTSLSATEGSFDAMFNLNVKATFFLAKEARDYFTPSSFTPGGFSSNVLLVSSIAGYLPASPIGIYGITKTAEIGLTRLLAQDYAPLGIRVNCLAPGIIRTKFSQPLVEAAEAKLKGETTGLMLQSSTPFDGGLMRRVGEASEMAAVAAFLCSADASYITGETTIAAGGVNCRL